MTEAIAAASRRVSCRAYAVALLIALTLFLALADVGGGANSGLTPLAALLLAPAHGVTHDYDATRASLISPPELRIVALVAQRAEAGSSRSSIGSIALRRATKEGGRVLYHYTSEAGERGIRETGRLNASQGARRARHGPGQYLTDLGSDSGLTRSQLGRRLFGSPVAGGRSLDRCLVISVCGLAVENPAPNIFRIPGNDPPDVSRRLIRSGTGPR